MCAQAEVWNDCSHTDREEKWILMCRQTLIQQTSSPRHRSNDRRLNKINNIQLQGELSESGGAFVITAAGIRGCHFRNPQKNTGFAGNGARHNVGCGDVYRKKALIWFDDMGAGTLWQLMTFSHTACARRCLFPVAPFFFMLIVGNFT